MFYSFQDAQFLYLVMEFLPGGKNSKVNSIKCYSHCREIQILLVAPGSAVVNNIIGLVGKKFTVVNLISDY